MAITNTSVLKPAVREYYGRFLIMTAFPKNIHSMQAQKRTLPKNNGDTVIYRRYNKLEEVTVPLQDGVTPPGTVLTAQDIKSRVNWYGNYIILTDQVQMTVEDRVLNEASKLLAQNLGQTVDTITRDILASTASVLQCSQGTNGGHPTELSQADIDAVIYQLMQNDAEMITDIVKASDRIATMPVRPAYVGFIDAGNLKALEKCAKFTQVANYSAYDGMMQNEYGSTNAVRWLWTSIGHKQLINNTTVYSNFIVAKEAYGCVHLGSENGEFYVDPLGSAGSADPLKQRGTVGWKIAYNARILNDAFMMNLLSSAA